MLIFLLVPFSAVAHGDWQWDFSGFASLGAGRINQPDVTFFGTDTAWSVDSDTMLGLQWMVMPTDRWQLTAQVVARGFNFEDDKQYQPKVEWLFLSYQWSPGLRTRLGRLRTPHYLFSESVEVGYSYPWARPPVQVYAALMTQFTHFDGVDLSVVGTWGESEWEVQWFGGQMNGSFLDTEVDIDVLLGNNYIWRYRDWLLRYSLHLDRTTLTNPRAQALIDAFSQFAALDPAFGRIGDSLTPQREWKQFHALGLQWESGNWAVIGEYFISLGPKRGFSTDLQGWYLSLQHRFGRVTPYGVIGAFENTIKSSLIDPIRDLQPTQFGAPEAVTEQLVQLQALGLLAFNSVNTKEESATLGLRFDVYPGVALKTEIQYFDFKENTGNLIPKDYFTKPSSAVAYTVILDLVF